MDPGKNNIKCVLVPTGARCVRKKTKKTKKLLYYIVFGVFFFFFRTHLAPVLVPVYIMIKEPVVFH